MQMSGGGQEHGAFKEPKEGSGSYGSEEPSVAKAVTVRLCKAQRKKSGH